MLGVNQLDFINYTTALKGNYRKGVHKLEAILANPTHAAEFAANLGGVSVVLGVPIGKEDKNSEALLSLLLASAVADDAVYTWLGQFYEFTSWDDLLGDAGRCKEMMADPFIWRALASSGVAVGKAVATLAGLDCGTYADMTAVAASSTAMTAVAASQTAMAAVAASQTAMAAVIANSTALNAVVASSTAMTAVAASATARAAIYASDVAFNTFLNLATYDTISGTHSGSGAIPIPPVHPASAPALMAQQADSTQVRSAITARWGRATTMTTTKSPAPITRNLCSALSWKPTTPRVTGRRSALPISSCLEAKKTHKYGVWQLRINILMRTEHGKSGRFYRLCRPFCHTSCRPPAEKGPKNAQNTATEGP